MRACLSGLLLVATLPWFPIQVEAQSVGQVFKRVKPSVMVIRTKEKDVAAQGQGVIKVAGVASGVLISADGKVMTAAHLVHTADEITSQCPLARSVRLFRGSWRVPCSRANGSQEIFKHFNEVALDGNVTELSGSIPPL